MQYYFQIGAIGLIRKFSKFILLVAMVTRILYGMEIFTNFQSGTPKDHSCEVW